VPKSLSKVYLHFVWSTKHRAPLLSPELRVPTWAYVAGILANMECPAVVVGGVADHMHFLCRFGRTVTIADVSGRVKEASSKWLHAERGLQGFYWQAGYGAFSISPSHVSALVKYIENQERHHETETFQDEFRRLLAKYGLECDERYVWD